MGMAHYSHQCCGSSHLPPPLELVVQSEARSAAHCLWSLGCWSYLHPNLGHSNILTQLQQLDPIFNMGVDVMRPAFNFEPKYGVTMLTRQAWTKGSGTPPAVKGLIWFTDGSRTREGTRAGVCGQSVWRRLSFSLGRYVTVFQAEIYAILACIYEIQFQNRPEIYVSVLTVRRLWKVFRPSEQCLHWSNSAKRHGTISPPSMWWGCTGSLDMLEYEVIRSLLSSKGAALFWGFLDLSLLWESIDGIYVERLGVGLINQHWA